MVLLLPFSSSALASGPVGAGGVPVTAFFGGAQITIHLVLSPASATLLAKNKNVNVIFMDTTDSLAPVINEIQGPGFNPLWQEADYHFLPGKTVRQLKSVADITNAVALGDITTPTLSTTNVFRCPVVKSAGK
jgi:hypothetical protein